jgi:hypothetical protein
MDRGVVLLQGLRRQLEKWLDPIKRSTCASKVSFVPLMNGEFLLRVEWTLRDGTTRGYDHEFTRSMAFGSSYGNSPLAWRIERRACDHARECIRQVLAARGV